MDSLSISLGSLLLSLFVLSLIRPEHAQAQVSPTDSTSSHDVPRAAIESYFKAHALGKSEFITQSFTPEAKIKFVDGAERKEWTREEFAGRFRQPAADEYRRVRRIQRLEVSGTAASAVPPWITHRFYSPIT